MAKDKILAKLEEHDRKFENHDRKFEEHDRRFDKIEQDIADFREVVMEALDHLVVNSDKLDQERLVGVHRTDELEKDIRFLETKTGVAREK